MDLRWNRFKNSNLWEHTDDFHPNLDHYLDYFWLMERQAILPPVIIRRIFGDLICRHIQLFGVNIIKDSLLHLELTFSRLDQDDGEKFRGLIQRG